ncbi:MAG: cation:proton antiporter [Nitriliruptoraceae bacterium]
MTATAAARASTRTGPSRSAAGIAVGPDVPGIVQDAEDIEILAKIGIALLLFVVGLKLDVRLVGKLGPGAVPRGGTHLLLDHHHREAADGQERTRGAPRPHRPQGS